MQLRRLSFIKCKTIISFRLNKILAGYWGFEGSGKRSLTIFEMTGDVEDDGCFNLLLTNESSPGMPELLYDY